MRARGSVVETVRDSVEVVVEQPGIDVKGHGRRCMPEHALDGLDVGAGGYGERCGYVPKFVRRESFDADRLGGLVEAHTATETVEPENFPARRREDEVIRPLALKQRTELLGDRPKGPEGPCGASPEEGFFLTWPMARAVEGISYLPDRWLLVNAADALATTRPPTGPNAARTPSLAMASVELIVYLVVLLGLGWWLIGT